LPLGPASPNVQLRQVTYSGSRTGLARGEKGDMAGRETLRQASAHHASRVSPAGPHGRAHVRLGEEARQPQTFAETLLEAVDGSTRDMLRRRGESTKGRGWIVRRFLLVGDVVGLSVAFLLALMVVEGSRSRSWIELGIFLASLPLWVVAAKLFGLYDRDESRPHHSTVDELVPIGLLLAVGGLVIAIASGYTASSSSTVLLFCLFGVLFVLLARAGARAVVRRSATYLQNTVIVGAGDVGQLMARKLYQHPEYGLQLVGFVDRAPKEQRPDLRNLTLLGVPEDLPEIVRVLRIERVIVAFSGDSATETLAVIRSLRGSSVRIDLVPRLFEMVGANAQVDLLEGMPLLGLRPASPGRSSLLIKRSIDLLVSAVFLVVTAPLFAYIAWRIKRESPGPVFFRQRRLGMNQREFTLLKFRTMYEDADEEPHREYIRATMAGPLRPGSNGLFKLERRDAITGVGQWLRRTSLDELPQLVNVLRGDMSLVGPRPCIPYEVEHFAPHHFDRFLVPAGMTGLWQVAARAYSNFGDALDIDALYARSWSPGMDLNLLLRTPAQLFRTGTT
jgi:exopolysaccharide biosynthesis polyprenyl glycosylphosphotransferase